VSGFSINPTTGVVTFDGTRPAGDYVLTIVVSDDTDTDSISVTITISEAGEPGDNTPPVLTSVPANDSTTETSALFNFTVSETSLACFVALPRTDPAPDRAFLRGQNCTSAEVSADNSVELMGLTPDTEYTFYMFARYNSNNDSDILEIDFTTASAEEPGDITPPELTSVPAGNSTTQTTAMVDFRSNENASTHYLVRLASEPEPNQSFLLFVGVQLIVNDSALYTASLSGLTPGTDYVFYIVGEDGSGNYSDILAIPFRTASADVPGTNPPSNSAPVFTGGSTGSGVSGTASTVYQASAVDSDGQAVNFALVSAVNSSSSSVTGFSIESATGRVNMAADVPAGTYTLVIRASDGTSTTSRTVVITVSGSSSVVVGSSAKQVVPGFALDSAKLTLRMKKAIRKFVLANPELTTVTCRGFTSLPASARDMKLARQRGKAVCDYILKLNPDLTVKVLKGGHTEKTGSENRRVRIVMR
jgi:hypothetical protein